VGAGGRAGDGEAVDDRRGERRAGAHLVVGTLESATGKHVHARLEARGLAAPTHQHFELLAGAAVDHEAGGIARAHRLLVSGHRAHPSERSADDTIRDVARE
jgi:hypothetical protein